MRLQARVIAKKKNGTQMTQMTQIYAAKFGFLSALIPKICVICVLILYLRLT